MPEYGRVLGMAAFGFEENAQYGRAEELAMQVSTCVVGWCIAIGSE